MTKHRVLPILFSPIITFAVALLGFFRHQAREFPRFVIKAGQISQRLGSRLILVRRTFVARMRPRLGSNAVHFSLKPDCLRTARPKPCSQFFGPGQELAG